MISGDWLSAPLESEERLHEEEWQPDAQGGFHNQTVQGFIRGRSNALVSEMNKMKRQPFLVRITDADGVVHLVGTPTEPLYFDFNFSSGGNAANEKGFTVRWTGRTRDSAFHYNPVF